MSIGLSLISAILSSGSRTAVRELDEVFFTEDELPAYRFLTTFYRDHGCLPTPEAFAENGVTLTAATGPASYHLDRARERASYNELRLHMSDLMACMQRRDVRGAVELLRGVYHRVGRLEALHTVENLASIVTTLRDSYEEAHLHPGRRGWTLGWSPPNYRETGEDPGTFDRLTDGAQSGDVITLVARPNVGKSYSLAKMALDAWRSGASVLFMTMEMTGLQIARRVVGINADLNPDLIRRGTLSSAAQDLFYESLRDFDAAGVPFHLASGSLNKTVQDLDNLMQEFTPDMTYIDASYLMRPPTGNQRKARWELLSDVGEEIKALALARGRPIVQTVQFNREAKKKAKEHDLGMIGGTDTVGQVSSIVVGIREGEGLHEHTRRRFKIMKNRDGVLGEFEVRWEFDPLNFSQVVNQEVEAARSRVGDML